MSSFLVKDKLLSVTKALPNGAATIATDGIDLGLSPKADSHLPIELLIDAPAMATAAMADAKTMKYEVYHDTDSAFGSEASLYGIVLTQTGAGGAGCAAAQKRIALPIDCKRYIRVKATGSTTGDATGSNVVASIVV